MLERRLLSAIGVFYALSLGNGVLSGLVVCRDHPKRPLDCWREVEEFRKQVSALEQVRLVWFPLDFDNLTRGFGTAVCEIVPIDGL